MSIQLINRQCTVGATQTDIREDIRKELFSQDMTSLAKKVMKCALRGLTLLSSATLTFSLHARGIGGVGFSLLNTGSALAQMPAFGEFRVNTVATGIQQKPKLAALRDGGFVAGWQSNQTGDYDIYGQRYNMTGLPNGSEFRMNSVITGSQSSSTLAALSDGGFVVAWYGWQTGDPDIYGQKYNATGLLDGQEFRINSITISNQYGPILASLRDGDFAVAWYGNQTGNYDIYGKRYNATGLSVGSEFAMNTNMASDQQYPILAALSDGGFVSAWHGFQTGSTEIYGQRYSSTGLPDGQEFRINTATAGSQGHPTLVGLNNGDFVAAWHGDQTGSYEIYSQRYNGLGQPVGSEFRVNTNTTSHQWYPTLAALGDGGFVIAWQGLQKGEWDIYGQRYNVTGLPIGTEFQINTNTTGDQYNPTLAALSDGGFVAAWNGNQTGSDDIYGQRYDASGLPVLNFTPPAPNLTTSSLVLDSTPIPSSSSQAESSGIPASQTFSEPAARSTQQTTASKTVSQTITSSSLNPSQTAPYILSITEVIYGISYPLTLNGQNVGTFSISGGTGSFDVNQSNTLVIELDPGVDLAGGTLTLFSDAPEGTFQSIELNGASSCLTYEEIVTTEGVAQTFQIVFAGTTCASAAKPEVTFFPTIALRV